MHNAALYEKQSILMNTTSTQISCKWFYICEIYYICTFRAFGLWCRRSGEFFSLPKIHFCCDFGKYWVVCFGWDSGNGHSNYVWCLVNSFRHLTSRTRRRLSYSPSLINCCVVFWMQIYSPCSLNFEEKYLFHDELSQFSEISFVFDTNPTPTSILVKWTRNCWCICYTSVAFYCVCIKICKHLI